MKEIKAIVQPFKLDAVADALQAIPGVGGITALDVRGFGHQRGALGMDVRAKGAMNYTRKVLLLLVVADGLVETVLETIRRHAHTGNFGDGKVFVSTVDEAVHLRTGARGEGVL
jgi:nitrogen regulatory protein P-II 1